MNALFVPKYNQVRDRESVGDYSSRARYCPKLLPLYFAKHWKTAVERATILLIIFVSNNIRKECKITFNLKKQYAVLSPGGAHMRNLVGADLSECCPRAKFFGRNWIQKKLFSFLWKFYDMKKHALNAAYLLSLLIIFNKSIF